MANVMYLPYNVGINKIHTKSVPRKCQLITWKHLSCLSLYFFQPSVTVDITSSIFPAVNYLVQGLTNCPTKAVTVGIVSDNTLLLWNSKLLKKSSLHNIPSNISPGLVYLVIYTELFPLVTSNKSDRIADTQLTCISYQVLLRWVFFQETTGWMYI